MSKQFDDLLQRLGDELDATAREAAETTARLQQRLAELEAESNRRDAEWAKTRAARSMPKRIR